MRKLEILFPALCIIFALLVVGAGAFFYDYSVTVMRFPYLVGSLLVLLAAAQLVKAVRARDGGDDQAPTGKDDGIGPGEFVSTGLWLLGILVAVQLLGYLAGIPLYLLVYFRAHGESWPTSLALSLGALAVTYFVFILFLKVRLPVMPLGFG
jgi:hypothetical protein